MSIQQHSERDYVAFQELSLRNLFGLPVVDVSGRWISATFIPFVCATSLLMSRF
jgi:hypothetical protein